MLAEAEGRLRINSWGRAVCVALGCVSVWVCSLVAVQANADFADFEYQVDSFEVIGNLPGTAVDNFDNGTLDSWWLVEEETVVESAGFLTLGTPGVHFGPNQFGDITFESERASVRSSAPSALDVVGGQGNFTATSRWASAVAGTNQFYGMELDSYSGVSQGINFNMINFEPAIASALGVPSGLGVWLGEIVGEGSLQSVSISASEITGDVLFRLSFDDSTNLIHATFSLDGGTTFRDPFSPIATNLDIEDDMDWYLEAEELRIVPEPNAWFLQLAALMTVGSFGRLRRGGRSRL